MMWRAQILGYEASQLTPGGQAVLNPTTGQPVVRDVEVLAQLQAATNAGASVVNISLGKRWPSAPSTTNDSIQARQYANPLLFWLRSGLVFGGGPRPLFVVSAGNHAQTQGLDAFWNGFPIAADSFPDHVLVVGASDASGNLWVDSKQSATMVVAPGVDVFGLGNSGTTPTKGSGTSFAAPLVSGLAGLLKSFDPSLTTPEIMSAIRLGATVGGVTAGGFPVVDAYESLRVASQKPGTPLCGNRTWVDGTALAVQRGTGVELITPAVSPASLNVVRFHGGRRVDVEYYDNGLQDALTFTFSPSGWTSQPIQPIPNALEESRAGVGSFFPGVNHAADYQIFNFHDRTAASVELVRTPTATYSPVTVATFTGFIGAYPAYSQLEERGFIGIRATDATGTVDIYSIDLGTGASNVIAQTTAPIPMPPFYTANVLLAVSEDGQELMVQKDRLDGTCELDFVGVGDGLTRFSTVVTPNVPAINPPCGDPRGGFSAVTARTINGG
jgi:hypothetical protein